jgi:hypothetical protein
MTYRRKVRSFFAAFRAERFNREFEAYYSETFLMYLVSNKGTGAIAATKFDQCCYPSECLWMLPS